jgi:pimeloyl-ACP methyl ester carboxylesterase/putative sterol carrier protein
MSTKASGVAATSPEAVTRRVRTLPKRFLAASVNGLAAVWELRIDEQPFVVSVAAGQCHVREGPAVAPHATIATDAATWLSMDEGMIFGIQAFLDQRLRVSGNLDLAVRLQSLFRPHGRSVRASDLQQIDVEAEGLHLSTYVVGSGPPVLLLHGLGASKISWLPIMPELSRSYRLVVPDLPGHGESSKPRGDYSMRTYAHVVRVLMDATGLERPIVVGNSMGGRIALELALRSPKRVAALGLLDPAVPGLRWRYIAGFTRVFPTEFGPLSFALRRRWMEAAVRALFAHPERLPADAIVGAADEFIRVYSEPAARFAFVASLRHLVTERPGPFWASMRRIRQPAMVVFGDMDRLVPRRSGADLAAHLPDCELHVLPEVGHAPQFEATQETLDLLLPFLERVRSA